MDLREDGFGAGRGAGTGVLCLAFWRRSPLWGLFVINAIAVGKMAWGVVDGAGTGWAMLGSALAVLVV